MPEETRVAVTENSILTKLDIERSILTPLVGNIYKGRIQNVLPGMSAAFVDIGSGKNAFLYIGTGELPDSLKHISSNTKFHIGQDIILQIEKDASGSKGPKGTMRITLPGHSLVLMPTSDYIGISHRIKDDETRTRLKVLAEKHLPENMGLVIRTAAATQPEEAFVEELSKLKHLWETICTQYKVMSAPALVYRDADIVVRVIRDVIDEHIDEIITNDNECYQRLKGLLDVIAPNKKHLLHLYEKGRQIFAEYGLEEEISRIYSRNVSLKSGAEIVIDRTEAMTVIDVNSGKNVGAGLSLEDTLLRVNLEAAEEIIRQLRLRDIGGIIVVDFIDMELKEHNDMLLDKLRELADKDRVKTTIVGMTNLGLVEITRKKSRRNFAGTNYSDCPCCGGTGQVSSPITVGIKISRDIRAVEKTSHADFGYEVEVHDTVAPVLTRTGMLNDLSRELHTKIKQTATGAIHPSRYVISRLNNNE